MTIFRVKSVKNLHRPKKIYTDAVRASMTNIRYVWKKETRTLQQQLQTEICWRKDIVHYKHLTMQWSPFKFPEFSWFPYKWHISQRHQQLSGKSNENKSFQPNEIAPSIHIMIELCYFSLDNCWCPCIFTMAIALKIIEIYLYFCWPPDEATSYVTCQRRSLIWQLYQTTQK